MRVSALIVSYNTCQLTLEAIASALHEAAEVVVVDNASRDGSAEAITASFSNVQLIRSPRNLGYAAGVNLAASHARSEALLVLNSDARLLEGAVASMAALLRNRSRAAMIGPALRYADGRPQASAFKFPGLVQIALDLWPIARLMETPINARIWADAPVEIDYPLGACMLIRRAAWDDVGPFDQGYFMYMEEVDWCRRAQERGWQIWHAPEATVIHHGGSSTRQHRREMQAHLWRSRLRYYERFHGPAYNRLMRALVGRRSSL